MSFVTIAQFGARYESSVPAADMARLQALLDDACDEAADIMQTTYADDDTVPGTVIGIICAAVRRAYDNPAGLQGETIGDYTWRSGYTGVAGSSSGGLYFTFAEQKRLRRAAGGVSVRSMELEGMLPYTVEEQYLTDSGSPEPILYLDPSDLP